MTSCRKDFVFEPSTGGLEFSKDTVYLDTVFTNIGSSTYTLKVYNKSNKDISIPTIKFATGLDSKYRMTVDGMLGNNNRIFSNVELLAKDSMFIFIETTVDVNEFSSTDFLYTDQIEFFNNIGEKQKVEVVTLIKDAYFIYPQRDNSTGEYLYESINLGLNDESENVIGIGSNLDENDPINGNEYIWGNDKPYVIYGYAFVPNGKTLNVNAGARVHFHADSGLIIAKNGQLLINGLPPDDNDPLNEINQVIFEGDRLEPGFSNVPGQWLAIINYSTRNDNKIEYLTLKNAVVGLLNTNLALTTDTEQPKITINNSQIYNCSNFGILARNSKITGQNIVTNNCGQASIACTYGGEYEFTHCTFNNSWNSTQQISVLLNNYFETDTTIYLKDLTKATFNNSIIYGSNRIQMLLDKKIPNSGTSIFNYFFNHCLIKFNNINNQFTNNPLYNFNNVDLFLNCEIAKNSSEFKPVFENANQNKLWLTEDLPNTIFPVDPLLTTFSDILNLPRATSPDLGAYQFVE